MSGGYGVYDIQPVNIGNALMLAMQAKQSRERSDLMRAQLARQQRQDEMETQGGELIPLALQGDQNALATLFKMNPQRGMAVATYRDQQAQRAEQAKYAEAREARANAALGLSQAAGARAAEAHAIAKRQAEQANEISAGLPVGPMGSSPAPMPAPRYDISSPLDEDDGTPPRDTIPGMRGPDDPEMVPMRQPMTPQGAAAPGGNVAGFRPMTVRMAPEQAQPTQAQAPADPLAGLGVIKKGGVPMKTGRPGEVIYGDPANPMDRTKWRVGLSEEARAAQEEKRNKVDFEGETKLRKEFIGQNAPFQAQVGNYQRLESAYSEAARAQQEGRSPAAADIAMVYAYMKMLDPTSVVREGEFATAENAGGVPSAISAMYNKIIGGGRLTPEIRRDFLMQAATIAEKAFGEYENSRGVYQGLARGYGQDPNRAVPDLSRGVPNPRLGRELGQQMMQQNPAFNVGMPQPMQGQPTQAPAQGPWERWAR